jgi:hypothetical protein
LFRYISGCRGFGDASPALVIHGLPVNEKESGTPSRSQVLLSYFRVGDHPTGTQTSI